jgi:hypothetical protein
VAPSYLVEEEPLTFCICFAHSVVQKRVTDQFEAARKGDLEDLRDALTTDNVNDTDVGGWTALQWAVYSWHFNCVKYCIEMGANVNACTNDGYTPLHYASSPRQMDIARVLLDAGAIVDFADNNGWTPLYRAIYNKYVDCGRLLVDRGAKLLKVKLDSDVPAIPDWITAFIESQSKCRCAATIIIGIRKYQRTTVTGNNDINVIRLISRHILSTRMDVAWVNCVCMFCFYWTTVLIVDDIPSLRELVRRVGIPSH